MQLTVVDIQSWASGAINEDRAGTAGRLAWVIDGATDVVEAPLTGGGSDASWFAERLHRALSGLAERPPVDMRALPDVLAARMSAEFAAAATRPPAGRHEHPSASGIIVRATEAGLDYVSVGDCTLLVMHNDAVVRVGVDCDDAGDRRLAAALTAFHATDAGATAEAARAHVWPSIRAGRAAMNEPHGYGVFSITPVPAQHVRAGHLGLPRGAHVLLASDGLMRLVDVFGRYTARDLHCAAIERGLLPLLAEVRAFEADDAHGRRYPRAKSGDDATGLLLRT